jgi:tetratricopeptide (TPR) repeat protein
MKGPISVVTAVLLAVILSTQAQAASRNAIRDCQMDVGDPDRGVAACTEVLDSMRLSRLDRAHVLTIRAVFYFSRGESDASLGDFDEAIRLEPDISGIRNDRGNIFRRIGDLDAALADYSDAIRLDPRSDKAYANRGQIWRLKGDLDRALADQNQQIRLNPNDPWALEVRGDTYRYRGDFSRAMADFDRSAALSPYSSGPYTGRGMTYEKMGDPVRARAEFEKAVAVPNPYHSQVDMEALAAAQARLAAINSGVAQPVIPTVSGTVTSHSIPTPAVAIPKVAVTKSTQGRRVALVIGNSAYENVPALANPQKDAAAMAAVLRNIGFEVVTLANNLTHEKMVASLRDFAHEAEKSDWAMVYYAGHGMEVGGVNYLIPVDARIAVDRDIQFEAVPLSQVLSAANSRKIKLIVLDACRDNPFTPRKSEAPETAAAASTAGAPIATRSTSGRGLAEVKVQGATLVVYAARDGQVALDGDGGNSPFAVAMIQRVATPGVEINKVFRLVRDDVVEATAGRQEPYTYGSLGSEDFFFVPK